MVVREREDMEGMFGRNIGRVNGRWCGCKVGLVDSYCYFVFILILVAKMEQD